MASCQMYVARQKAKADKERACKKDLDFKIILDTPTEIKTSFDKLQGKVHLTNKSPTKSDVLVYDVRVWLEGTATTRFRAKKGDGRTETQMQHLRFLPDETTDLSHVSFDIIRKDAANKSLKFGSHTFPFEIQLNGEILPCAFTSTFGRVQYRLILCVQFEYQPLIQFSKSIVMTTKGCLNLSLDPNLDSPFIVTKTKEKFFSNRLILKLNLILSKRGYIPGEYLNFQVNLENFNCEFIEKIGISLIQRNIYSAQKTKKTTSLILGTQEFVCETKDGAIHQEGGFQIPANLMPSFSKQNKKSIEILYFILYNVDSGGKNLLKGEAMIVIGSAREEFPGMEKVQRVPNLNGGRGGRDDDTISLQSFYSVLPPSYSGLSSRRSSIETLPPPYDEVFGGEDWD